MSLSDAQTSVAAFTSEHDLEAPVSARVLDVVSEVGELAKEVLEGSAYGAKAPVMGANWEGELGDLVFSVLSLANITDVDLDAALADTLDKYRRRMASTGTPGSGSHEPDVASPRG